MSNSPISPLSHPTHSKTRNLVIVLGDQLDIESAAFDEFDARQDTVWMAEVAEESTHVWSHQARIVLFLSAMRHFRDELLRRQIPVHYSELDGDNNSGTLHGQLTSAIHQLRPQKLICVQPGEWRLSNRLTHVARTEGVEIEVRADRHFICSQEEFSRHANSRKQLRMEFFYREMRRKTGVLMDHEKPLGDAWNFDTENRQSFGKGGPGPIPKPIAFPVDRTTQHVMKLVRHRFSEHPGKLESFDWPVTRTEALLALEDFISHRLPLFGAYEDAMWTEEPVLYHSRLSAALNLKLLNPREVIAAAEQAYRQERAPLAAVEGFIRQILGWREFVRGVYWQFMPGYQERNGLGAELPLPSFYWTGQTEMHCLRQALQQTLELGYAHHIQRLMVTGLYALLLGVNPRAVHQWYLAVYVDAVEWVELPNTLGMSQFGDGGVMASKPYAASGKYIQRMSNYCKGCRYNPSEATGPNACPFTTLYWDFLQRHRSLLAQNQRMAMQLKNLARIGPAQLGMIQRMAEQLRKNVVSLPSEDHQTR